MRFSKNSTYGLRALACLAKRSGTTPLSLSEISKQENISKKYLEQIFIHLKRSGLIKARKGQSGGYQLTRSPQKITVFDIIEAVEGRMTPAECLSADGTIICKNSLECGVVPFLADIQEIVVTKLKNTSLYDIEKNHT